LAPICDYPYTEALLDQAIQTQSPYSANGRLLLVLGALSQRREQVITYLTQAGVLKKRGGTAATPVASVSN